MNINRIEKFDADKVYFTSDTHFFHERIIDYFQRPFTSVKEMNEALINNWNSAVPTDGIVFYLGDFAKGDSAIWSDILCRLSGHIHLIAGNHDWPHVLECLEDYIKDH